MAARTSGRCQPIHASPIRPSSNSGRTVRHQRLWRRCAWPRLKRRLNRHRRP
jgi:hypothetical protein